MKVSTIVRIEIEVDDEYLPLTNDNFWYNNWVSALTLSHKLADTIQNTSLDKKHILEVGAVYDVNGAILFEK